jgi:hypothetical protein
MARRLRYRLHAEGFGHGVLDDDWHAQLGRHGLGWVCAIRAGELAGFVNVAWTAESTRLSSTRLYPPALAVRASAPLVLLGDPVKRPISVRLSGVLARVHHARGQVRQAGD